MSLAQRLQQQINRDGPISVANYMTLCLLDPKDGYYPTRDPIGAGADFITAPEVSQIFGELIGVWVANGWAEMGQPETLHLAEPGPGKGTMMSDILRAARAAPELSAALQIHLIETSAALVAVQAKTLQAFAQPLRWADHLGDTGSGPLIVVANEFLDCLPVRQFVSRQGGWFERFVACNEPDQFQYVLGQTPVAKQDLAAIPPNLRKAADNSLVEIRPAVQGLLDVLSERSQNDPVLALFIDYGPAISEPGDTLQAVSAHQKVDPLQKQGHVDLTSRVDFAETARAAKARGLAVAGPVTQAEWLQNMGLMQRAADLSTRHPDQRAKIARQVHRLSDPDEMGALFKCMAIYSDTLPKPAGF